MGREETVTEHFVVYSLVLIHPEFLSPTLALREVFHQDFRTPPR